MMDMEKIPDTLVEDVRHEAHAFIQMFGGDETPLAKFIYERGTNNPEDALAVFALSNVKGLGTVDFFRDRSPEQEQTLVDILREYLEIQGQQNVQEKVRLASKFDSLIRSE